MAALGWTIEDILKVVILPAPDRDVLLNEFRDVRFCYSRD
jgi:hypothetical protein